MVGERLVVAASFIPCIKGEESKNNFCRRSVILGTIPDGTHYKITKPVVHILRCGTEKRDEWDLEWMERALCKR